MMVPSRSHSRIALLFGALLLPSMAQSQDLAAVAKKEKERRAKVANPVKVLTEGDGKEASAKGAGSVTALGEQAGSSAPATGIASKTDPDAKRVVWKTRADTARNAVTAQETKLAQMERDLAALRSDMTPVSAADAMDPMRLQKREALTFRLNKDIEAQKAAVAEAKKALAAFEDEARRSGVPAGWLR